MELLLAAGAALDQADNDGDTPLGVAVQEGHANCTKVLLAARARVDEATNVD